VKTFALIVVFLIIGIATGYYLLPVKTIIKVEEKIVYKDKIINEVKTILKYKDGTEKTVIITKTDVKEIEKTQTKQKTTVLNEKTVYTPYFGLSYSGDKLAGILVHTPLFLNIAIGGGVSYSITTKDPALLLSVQVKF
jgi:hypothetical protein